MLCANCSTPITSISSITYDITDNHYRQTYTINVCNEQCKQSYLDLKCCQICFIQNTNLNIIHDKSVCSTNYKHEKPTCMEKFTGLYSCDMCDKTKNMYEIVFLITHNDIIKEWGDNIINVVKENNISKLTLK